MRFYGLQKLTLLDYPDKVAATVFTGGCPWRCPFCHNADLVFLPEAMETISSEEVLQYLKKRSGVLDGICISGGEPLMHSDLESFIRQCKELGLSVKLDTCGCYPDRLKSLVEKQLIDYVAMDIKNSPERYAETIGLAKAPLGKVRESIDFLRQTDIPYEFRCTVVAEFHQKKDIHELGDWLAGSPVCYLQKFVDSGNTIEPGLHACSDEEMREFQKILMQYMTKVELRGVD
ncbi:anaerobic ribonucleoside-triphosphate reductase activating protein [Vagococcus elongatus]|uniref:Anaerobic ribonucleoside-triphosphate reductase activating protein n=1 Tax=Vagococcus elongatus TaxID=180344 RepID=A0A430AR91_9ENTE|nr:anaerobic ribonucleoside-triphosphate reductase activating protein [Vagococcus elongatus]RSU10553.1 anaerobic ribonucleoside-triphosphate reductase activating protein [Vagococcus elongatus]